MYTSATLPFNGRRFPFGPRILTSLSFALLTLLFASSLRAATPRIGDVAPDFTLSTLNGNPVKLSALPPSNHTVIVLLRGWPGYQCPFCTTQVYEYMGHAADFSAQNVQVILIYPGPSDALQVHAQEFLKDKPLPGSVVFLLDQNYEFTNRYSLRWDAKEETAYPSTFVLDRNHVVRFAQVSHEHGDRISAAAVLRFLNQPTAASSHE